MILGFGALYVLAADVPMKATEAAVKAAEAAMNIYNCTSGLASLTVAAGTKVVWTNRHDIPHTVTSALQPAAFESPVLESRDAFSLIFNKPGTYRYFGALHPHMQGEIVVR